jgi:hypothetical protein
MPNAGGGYKRYAVDFWKDLPANGDPDCSHYSDDPAYLEQEAKKRQKDFATAILYERKGPPEWMKKKTLWSA